MTDDDELILRPKEPTARRQRTAKAPTAIEDLSPTVRIEMAFKLAFERRFGFPMAGVMYKAPRDRKLLKDIIAQEGESGTLALVHAFFGTTDPQIRYKARCYNVPDFSFFAPRLKLLQHGKDAHVHERTASNRDEIRKAMGNK